MLLRCSRWVNNSMLEALIRQLRSCFLSSEFYFPQAYLNSSVQNDTRKSASTVWGLCLIDVCISLPRNTMPGSKKKKLIKGFFIIISYKVQILYYMNEILIGKTGICTV